MPKSSAPRNHVALAGYLGTPRTSEQQSLTYEEKLEVIDFYWRTKDYLNLTQMVEALQTMGFKTICPQTISRYVKQEARLREYVSLNANRLCSKRETVVSLPAVNAAVYEWVLQKLRAHVRLSDAVICEKARQLCQLSGVPEQDAIRFSRGWLRRFKQRNGLKRFRFHGERASAPIERIQPEQARMRPIIAGYEPRNVLNVDETGLYWRMPPKSGIADGETGGLKDDKSRMTYVLCASMDGSEKCKPLIIGYAKQPRCFGSRTPAECGFDYHTSPTAWMNATIWQGFLADLNEDMRRQNRHVLLLCDNARSHMHNPAAYSHIRVEFLAPNLTAYLQPLDAGVIASFKAHYRSDFIKLVVQRSDAGIANIYKIDQRQAMQLAEAAWASVSNETIVNCWRHTGICPEAPAPTAIQNTSSFEDPDATRLTLLTSLGLIPGFMHPDVHPDVYRMVDALCQELQRNSSMMLNFLKKHEQRSPGPNLLSRIAVLNHMNIL